MSKMIIPAEMSEQLRQLMNPVELCDESGKVLGRFSPQAAVDEYERVEARIGEEELQRREREGGGRALAEILADLEKRA